MTNLGGRVILGQRAMTPPSGVRTDLEVLADLAERLGRGRFFSSCPADVFEELRRASAGGIADYSGIINASCGRMAFSGRAPVRIIPVHHARFWNDSRLPTARHRD